MIGKLLGGRYRIIEILGAGGFSQTYVAEDTHRPGNPTCVVKHLKPASSNSSFLQNARRLFQSEAQTLEKLGNHDQIPRLLAYFEENKEFYLVQDYIQGHSLSVELQPGKRWSESQVYKLLQEVLGILVYVHSHGVIHRDLKPNNLIQRQQDGKLVLVDFGSVKQTWTQVVTAQGETCATFAIATPATIGIGTPGYMPTEQGRGRPRPNSDLYALGIIAIQALTGQTPMLFQEDVDNGEILWRDQAQVSHALAAIIAKMVCYHFKDRYQSATEVLQALEEINNSDLATEINPPSLTAAQQSRITQNTVILPDVPELVAQNVVPITLLTSDPSVNADCAPHLESANLPEAQITSSPQPEIPVARRENELQSYPVAKKFHRLQISAAVTAIFVSLVAGYALYWQPRPSISKTLRQMVALKATGKFDECIAQAPTITENSRYYVLTQALVYECQLAQATTLAARRNLPAAINTASEIPQDAAVYQNAQQQMRQWSDDIMKAATNNYNLGKLQDAVTIAQTIPETSPVYQQAQGTIQQWNTDWEKSNSSWQAAKSALNQGKWDLAIAAANQVADTPYWQQKIQPIKQAATSKIAAAKNPATIPVPPQPQRITLRRRTRIVTTQVKRTISPRRTRRVATAPKITPRRIRITNTTSSRRTRAVPQRRVTPRRTTRAANAPTRRVPPIRRSVKRSTTRSRPSYSWTTKTVP